MLLDAILCVTRLIFFALIHLGAKSIDTRSQDLKSSKGYYEPDYKRSAYLKANRATARGSAFRLLCLFLTAELEYQTKSRRKICNADFFCCIPSCHFQVACWQHHTGGYEEKIHMSKKQRANLNTLPVSEPGTGDV